MKLALFLIAAVLCALVLVATASAMTPDATHDTTVSFTPAGLDEVLPPPTCVHRRNVLISARCLTP